ncbi:hypothetical protein BDP27DRAFT_1360668 [Rhodocollybia butyracea]|uniref:Uncharacterized protein n=1 Tax=Rhodocollybia butyracea TaxID=206335 RepID=A0A9P5Q1E7_9AGAR|nr:hypothetical protein BDP27DRAFT_1360668 [Rhodocollybia butyracea]
MSKNGTDGKESQESHSKFELYQPKYADSKDIIQYGIKYPGAAVVGFMELSFGTKKETAANLKAYFKHGFDGHEAVNTEPDEAGHTCNISALADDNGNPFLIFELIWTDHGGHAYTFVGKKHGSGADQPVELTGSEKARLGIGMTKRQVMRVKEEVRDSVSERGNEISQAGGTKRKDSDVDTQSKSKKAKTAI